MIHFAPFDAAAYGKGPLLHVHPDQARFVTADLIGYAKSWSEDKLFHSFLILDNSKPIGFFSLDFEPSRHLAYIQNRRPFCVLRNYFIDQSQQGKGFAGKSMSLLADFVRRNFAGTVEIFLTVNEKNPVAQKIYARAGFRELPERYLGGASGPQIVMFREV